jgi:hypothetical protein
MQSNFFYQQSPNFKTVVIFFSYLVVMACANFDLSHPTWSIFNRFNVSYNFIGFERGVMTLSIVTLGITTLTIKGI